MKTCRLIVLAIFISTCKKETSSSPETPLEPREVVVGTYLCSYKGHQVQGDSGWDISGTELVVVQTFSTPGSLSITPMTGGTAILQDDKTFSNTRSIGHFSNDSIYLYTYSTPAATSSTFFTGRKN